MDVGGRVSPFPFLLDGFLVLFWVGLLVLFWVGLLVLPFCEVMLILPFPDFWVILVLFFSGHYNESEQITDNEGRDKKIIHIRCARDTKQKF